MDFSQTDFLWIGILAASIEIATIVLRFGFGLQARKHTRALSKYTLRLRIHHGYVGLLLIGFSALFSDGSFAGAWLLRIGAALFVSDAIHHLVVLWPLTGSPQFDIFYENPDDKRTEISDSNDYR